jgi:hypothetical protein
MKFVFNENQKCSIRVLQYLKQALLNENNGFDKNTLLFEVFVFNLRRVLMTSHFVLET